MESAEHERLQRIFGIAWYPLVWLKTAAVPLVSVFQGSKIFSVRQPRTDQGIK